jgi:hypothetical protein
MLHELQPTQQQFLLHFYFPSVDMSDAGSGASLGAASKTQV